MNNENCAPIFALGERVILGRPEPDLNGARGVVEARYGYRWYDVRLDDSRLLEGVWDGALLREADHPDYPLPETK